MKSQKQFKYVLTDNEDRSITIAEAPEEENFTYSILVEDEPIFGFDAEDVDTIIEAFQNINTKQQ
jgi:ABC-type phosphate/phosphonate transport system ATPase subunit